VDLSFFRRHGLLLRDEDAPSKFCILMSRGLRVSI
jgi:hypothetical protein